MSTVEIRYHSQLTVDVFQSLDSTNQYLLDHIRNGATPWAVLSEEQTAGRGRQGKTWVSTPHSTIALSFLWQFTRTNVAFSSLSIAVGAIIVSVLKKIAPFGLELKWPNDILYQSRKLAGILLEARGNKVVIGIGINTVLPPSSNPGWIDLTEISDNLVSRNEIIGWILNALLEQLPLYQEHGLAPFISTWQQHDALHHKPITLLLPDRTITGIAAGINEQGELQCIDEANQLHSFIYGEASIICKK